MDDNAIVELYFDRSERAISETKTKYGRMLLKIAFNILKNPSDAEECENDTYLKTWNAIPPTRPTVFPAFLSKITRNLSLDRYDKTHAQKRGSGEIPLLLDEMSECIPAEGDVMDRLNGEMLTQSINHFLSTLNPETRNIFMRRYWFGNSLQEIADMGGIGLSKVKMALSRSRKALKEILEKEGY